MKHKVQVVICCLTLTLLPSCTRPWYVFFANGTEEMVRIATKSGPEFEDSEVVILPTRLVRVEVTVAKKVVVSIGNVAREHGRLQLLSNSKFRKSGEHKVYVLISENADYAIPRELRSVWGPRKKEIMVPENKIPS